MTHLNSHVTRAPFNTDLEPLRKLFRELISTLEEKSPWYGSIFFERRASKSCAANLKQTQLNDQVSQGVVMRIYDGYTLYERATDDLNPDHLKSFAKEFAERVKKTTSGAGAVLRPYTPPNWKARISAKLEDEIKSQIPTHVTAETPVHFGIRFKTNPKSDSLNSTMDRLKGVIERCKKSAVKNGMDPSE